MARPAGRGNPSVKRVCVTGAGGFLGSHMVAFLKKKGYWVRAVDKQWPEYRRELWGQADEVVTKDLREPGTTYQIVGEPRGGVQGVFSGSNYLGGVDWVFHFAADMGGVGYFFSDADYTASLDNLKIDTNVLSAIGEDRRLFYASSFCAYPIEDQVLVDGKAKRPMVEEDLGGGPGEQLYGEEKRIITMFLDKAPFDARAGIFSTIYGPYQEIEDEKRSKFPTAITKKVWESKKTGEPIEIWGDGTQIRTYLYIDDFLEKAYRIMSHDTYEGPVNIGSDEQVSCKEMADYACELAGVEPNYRFNQSKPTGVMGKDTDNSKFNRIYGEVPQTSAREGFKKLYHWLASLDKAA